jgi:hypothetical protein
MPSATARQFQAVAARLGFRKTRTTGSHERWNHSDGRIHDDELLRNLITRNDLEEMLRLQGRIDDTAQAKLAILERNGQISAISRGT